MSPVLPSIGVSSRRFAVAAALVTLVAGPDVRAESLGKIEKRLRKHGARVQQIGDGIRPPTHVGEAISKESLSRKLVEGRVQFGLGNYGDAALILYDIVEGHSTHRAYDEALYYLAESLYQKDDRLAARSYFRKIVLDGGSTKKYYQQSLERLVELSMKLQDSTEIEKWLRALDQLPAVTARPQVPYVRGKYAHYKGRYDEAIAFFEKVDRNSPISFQAAYFKAVALTGKGDLAGAIAAFKALRKRRARSADARRVRELASMALGRLYYERDQPSQAIDHYLNVNRKSELFDEVLEEVAWVYVKNKDYNRALRALELLQLTDPRSAAMPEIRILEGNLRIRRAQELYEKNQGNPREEYDKALKIFTSTRGAFTGPLQSLEKMLAEKASPLGFLEQVVHIEGNTFDSAAMLPEVAVAWLRREPVVARLMTAYGNMMEIRRYLDTAKKNIRQIELAINSPARVDVFPELAERRYRLLDIRESLDSDRIALVRKMGKALGKKLSADVSEELLSLRQQREHIASELDYLLGGGKKGSDRRAHARGQYDELDKSASEIAVAVQSSSAQVTALDFYSQGHSKKPEDVAKVRKELLALKDELDGLHDELKTLREDIQIGRSAGAAGGHDEREMTLRRKLRAAIAAEARYVAIIAQRSGKNRRRKVERAMAALKKTDSISQQSARALEKLNQVADAALVRVRSTVDEERQQLAAFATELARYDGEAGILGTEMMTNAVPAVAKKFEDVIMRSELGVIDVAWSHKDSNERLRRRLVLDRARERKVLDADFADVLDELRSEEARAADKAPSKSEGDAAASGEGGEESP